MKPICLLLLLLFSITSCDQPEKRDVSENTTNESKIIPAELVPAKQPGTNVIGGDPTFVDTKDTISRQGPFSITRNILQDKNGNIWLATWQGIMRYDGKLFTNFTLKEGLKRFHVFSILEDRTGNIWFGMIGGGLYRYDGSSFIYFTMSDGLAGNNVMCMMEDRLGNIWFGTNNGLSCYDGKTFTNYTTKDGLIDNSVLSVLQDRTGKLWFGTEGGVNSCFDISFSSGGKRAYKFINETALPFRHVLSMVEDKTGKIWIGSQVGLSCYDSTIPFKVGDKYVANVSTNFTPNIFKDKTGNLWLSSGVLNSSKMVLFYGDPSEALKKGTKAFTKITSEVQVFGVTEDREGNIWFGTQDGARCYDPLEKLVTDFKE